MLPILDKVHFIENSIAYGELKEIEVLTGEESTGIETHSLSKLLKILIIVATQRDFENRTEQRIYFWVS